MDQGSLTLGHPFRYVFLVSIYFSIWLFCYVLIVAKFCFKIILSSCYPVVGMSSCILPLLAGRIFFLGFGMYYLIQSLYLFSLLSLIASHLLSRVVVLVLIVVLLFSFRPNIFQRLLL